MRDRSLENQQHRASGLNLVVAAITLWNTVYLERAAALLGRSQKIDLTLLQHVSPLGWEHVGLTGDYLWRTNMPKAGIALYARPPPDSPAPRLALVIQRAGYQSSAAVAFLWTYCGFREAER